MAKLPHLIKKKAIENGAVDGEVIKLSEGQSIKAVHGGLDVDLIKAVAGKVQVLGSEVELKASSDAKLLEAKAYTDQAKADLNLSISAEASRAQATETDLSDSIIALEGVVTSNNAARLNSQSALANMISAEETARIAGDTALQNALTSAQASFTSAIQTVSADLVSEISRAQASELAKLAEAKIYTDGKVSDLQASVNFIKSNVDPVAIDSITEVVAAFKAADLNLNGAITSLASSASSALTAEVARAEGVEQGLQSAINTLSASLQSASLSIAQSISDETAARISADSALSGRVQVLEAVSKKKANVILSSINPHELAHKIAPGSMTLFNGASIVHEGFGYDLSEVNGKTVVTFTSAAFEIGDTVFFYYEA